MKYFPAIKFVAPYRIYLPDEFFEVMLDGKVAKVKAVPITPNFTAGTLEGHGPNIEISHDIFGSAGRTDFYTVLGEEINIDDQEWKRSVCDRDYELLKLALNYVNRVLTVYRDQDVDKTGATSFHVIELVRGDLSDISLVVVDSELNQVQNFSVNWPGYRRMGFGEAVVRDPVVVDAIRHYLSNGIAVPIERELLTSAQNHLWRQQLRLVPVEANTAFESYSYSALKRAVPETALPDSSDLFTKLQELEKVFLSKNSATSKCIENWFDISVPGWKGLINPSLKQWHGSCYELRNRVIHRGYNSVTMEEAEAALKATRVVISMIERLLLDSSS